MRDQVISNADTSSKSIILFFSFSNDNLIIADDIIDNLSKFFELDLDPELLIHYTESLQSQVVKQTIQ